MPSTTAEQVISTAQLPGSQFAALLAAIRDSEHRLDESWRTSRRTFSKRRTKWTRKPSTVCGTTSHTIIKRRHTRSKHASTRRWRKASKMLMTPSLLSRTRRRSSAPERLWKNVRGFWPIGKSLLKLPIGRTTDGGSSPSTRRTSSPRTATMKSA